MAAKNSKAKTENQETNGTPAPENQETNGTPVPEEKSEPTEEPKEPAEGSDTEAGEGSDGNTSVSEELKVLVAMRPILYLAKQYKAGDKLPVNNQEMVDAWIEAGSAAWQKPNVKQFP